MSNEIEEHLSALVDGEVPRHQVDALLAQLKQDPPLRARWARYHLIQDALHRNLPPRTDHRLASNVAAAIRNEPAIFLPTRRRRPLHPWAKQAVGIAVAASVTAAAVLGAQALHHPEGNTTVVAQSQESASSMDASLEPYLVNHNENAVSGGAHGILPYMRLVSHGSESE